MATLKRQILVTLISLLSFFGKGFCDKNSLVEKQVKISDELTLHYAEQGAPDGEPVILLHGYSDSWHSYELVMPLLPESLHVYAVSMRGHGNSSRPAGSYHPDVMADDIADLMKNLGINKAAIVGHSLGATVAQSFATRYLDKITAIVLIGGFAHYNKKTIYDFKAAVDLLTDPIEPAFVSEFQKSTLYRSIPKAFFKTVVSESMKVPVAVWKSVVSTMLGCNYLDALQKISIPTLLIWGNRDVFASIEDQQLLQRAIKSSKLSIFKNVGHGVHWEDPGKFSKEIRAFLSQNLSEN
ncbi:alpha/beta hydrolase [Dyadobacter sp. CY107]|uniref:alpha/beta fold hydrolase n=1 Tax=Dyadobacter fanqingshengii TaxID=2906443 RepID=UPI001F3F4025|nr:alpha/beta hydrolase [Dyadobacter fanqingshengii]MCF2505181.1 alpha/beta hydrolase [Dyadobacter fanqingshengii]